jgi:hypothetical protein
LQKVESDKHNDYFLKIESETKRKKEESMNNRFQEGFEKGLQTISASLSKKSGTKLEEKVFERIGRLKQKYQSIHRHFNINCEVEIETVVNRKAKEKREVRRVKSMSWSVKENIEINETSGTYFLRTSLPETETLVWEGYNTIREEESTFRCLKSELDLRPIFHKKDDASMAHLNLGLLAYWVVNTIRFRLKRDEVPGQQAETNSDDKTSINFCWKEIVRIMNTQKAVTTTAQNNYEEIILIRRCSEPNVKVQAIYDKLKYKPQPFTKRKFVVHKSEFEKIEYPTYQGIIT